MAKSIFGDTTFMYLGNIHVSLCVKHGLA